MITRSTLFISILLLAGMQLSAQELFVYSEPASNMATKSIGIRANNYLAKQTASNRYNYFMYPEIMVGISKKVMAHAEVFFNNYDQKFGLNGASLYAKYRVYSDDGVHNHFRVALYGKAAINSSPVTQPAIDLVGYNTGIEGGVVATKLIQKVALSAGSSLVHAFDNLSGNKFTLPGYGNNALSYNLAFGKLMLPKEYSNYEQTNLNLMLEVLGQTNLAGGKSFVDLAPSLQLIILSRMRADLGYRFPIVNDLARTSDRGFLLRFEYNIFNAYK